MPRGRPPSNKSAAGGGAGSAGAAPAVPAIPSPYAALDTEAALAAMEKDTESLIDPALFRLTSGMPQHELKTMVKEADDCEAALIEEIRILEESMGVKEEDMTPRVAPAGGETKSNDAGDSAAPAALPAHFTNVDDMLASDLSAASGFYGVSALLGRLRTPLEMPLPPNSPMLAEKSRKAGRKKSSSGGGPKDNKEAQRREKDVGLAKTRALLALSKDPSYSKVLEDNAPLLALCKRISGHRSSIVFRRPVNPREAPGYTERIPFPIDLSLVKKMVQAGMIRSFRDLHERMGLICHNCVKYNGRESDYGGVTREFEAYVDDSIIAAVNTHNANAARAAAAAKTAAAPAGAAAAASASAWAPTAATAAPAGPAPAGAVAGASVVKPGEQMKT